MRSRKEIEHKYNQLAGRHLVRLFEKNLSKRPWNCIYGHLQPGAVTNGSRVEVEYTGFCNYNVDDPTIWEGKICETASDAKGCPYFVPKTSKQELYNWYLGVLKNPEELQHEYRDLYILQWVLGRVELSWWQQIKNKWNMSKNYTEKDNVSPPEASTVGEIPPSLFEEESL